MSTNCNNCGNTNGVDANTVAELQSTVEELSTALSAFLCGHPILLIQHADDVAAFDMTSGLGSGCWDGWAACIGGSHTYKGKLVPVPNFVDRFIVMANGTYAVGDTGGLDTVQLITAELPIHTHVLNDPGHTHTIIDTGHVHAITDDMHTHAQSAHTHTFVTEDAGAHTHDVAVENQGTGQRSGGETNTATSGQGTYSTTSNGAHSHNGTTGAGGGGATSASATGIEVNSAFTGITNDSIETGITIDNEGADQAHENRPPYYAAIYVMKL